MKLSALISLILLTGCTSSQVAPIEVHIYEVSDNSYNLIAISEKKLTSSNNEIDSVFEEKINELCPYGYLISEPTGINGSNDESRKRNMEHYIKKNAVKSAYSYSKSVNCTI
ncbi:hypothetical protein [Photobacterium sp. J15]|uniref:hypothetical protein n=1 Tax=Photobacterium sp. J15 TaxID=265901 RepID=UPI0007E3F1F3|nr:hypothetical protein [Photobacterium sp. J15]